MRILLASASKRRGSILRQRFDNIEQVALQGVDESVSRASVADQVREVVSRKAQAVMVDESYDVIIVADTLVEDPDDELQALGQPDSKESATAMLLRLRGRRHRVHDRPVVRLDDGVRILRDHADLGRSRGRRRGRFRLDLPGVVDARRYSLQYRLLLRIVGICVARSEET